LERLVEEGAEVSVFDPKGTGKALEFFPEIMENVRVAASPEQATEGVETLIIATEWPEFASADFVKVKENMVTPVIFDGRNLLEPDRMQEQGFEYRGIGRGVDLSAGA